MHALIEVVLGRLLTASIHAAVLAAVVWVLCRCLPRLPPAAQCWLWWLVALQAVVGLCVDPLQLPWLPPAPLESAPLVSSQFSAAAFDVATLPLAVNETASPWPSILLICWAIGVAAMGWFTLRQRRRVRELLNASTPCEDAPLLQSVALAAQSRGLRHAPGMRLSQDIDSPVLVGYFRPVLLLPGRIKLSGEELDMAIAHELTHLRRGDLWWGCVPAIARHLFFFHPFVHLAVREYGIAREADCDATVVAAERHSRRDYGNLLLRLGTRPVSDAELAVASPTFHALSRRLTMLQNMTFLSRTGSLALVLVVAAVGVMPMRLVAAAATPAAPSATPAPAVAPPAATLSPAAPADAPNNAAARKPTIEAPRKVAVASAPAAPLRDRPDINNIDFRRVDATSGTGRLSIVLDDARIPVELKRQDNRIVVDFTGVDVPDRLRHKYDVAAFGTPVTAIDATRTSGGSQFVISTEGDVEHLAYWAGGQYVVEVKPRIPPQVPVQAADKTLYTGERMTVSFKDIEVRTLLQIIADTSHRNIVIHDGVTGAVTLNINNVPWDQVLDIVLKAKGLEKRVQSDVIWVFPAGAQGAQNPAAPTPTRLGLDVNGGSVDGSTDRQSAAAPGSTQESGSTYALQDLQARLREAQESRRQLESRLGATSGGSPSSGSAEVVALRGTLASLEDQLMADSAFYGPQHPRIAELRAKIESTRAALQSGTATALKRARELEARFQAAANQEQASLLNRASEKQP